MPVRPTLGPVVCVSIQVPNLHEASRLYQRWFGYQEVCRGRFRHHDMRRWGLNKLANRSWRYLAPHGHPGPGGIRLISGGAKSAKAKPLTSIGWAAAELSVIDVGAIASRLTSSPFLIIGAPRALGSNPAIKAMQVAGPHGEVFYLTDVRAYDGKLNLVKARHEFDKTFIVVLASKTFDETRNYYESRFQVKRISDHQVPIPVLNKQFDMMPETGWRIGSLQLSGSSLIEIDQYPEMAIEKSREIGGVPAGVSIVTFASELFPLHLVNRAQLCELISGRGALTQGHAGEFLEFVMPPAQRYRGPELMADGQVRHG